MREKSLRLLVTFRTTTAAMAVERHCLKNGVAGRLIPVPREISAGCGMAWSAAPEAREDIERALAAAGLSAENFHEIVI